MFHEQSTTEQMSNFRSRNEIVGWTQGHTCRPVTGVVVGREMSGLVSYDNGSVKMRVKKYIKPTGNNYILSTLPNAQPHNGIAGPEYVISEDLSLEYAMSLDYSSYNSQSNNSEEATQRSINIEDYAAQNALIAFLPILLQNGEPAYVNR